MNRSNLGADIRVVDPLSIYNDVDLVDEAMTYLKLKRFRTATPIQSKPKKTVMALADRGYQFLFLVRNQGIDRELGFIRDLAASVIGIEEPNEVDHTPINYMGLVDKSGQRPNLNSWKNRDALYAYLRDLCTGIAAIPELAKKDRWQHTDRGGALDSSFCTRLNSHPYTQANAGEQANWRKWASTKPGGFSEMGPHRSILSMTGTAQLEYQRQACSNFMKFCGSGSIPGFFYQLFDDTKDESFNFGLFERDGTPRPAAKWIRAG